MNYLLDFSNILKLLILVLAVLWVKLSLPCGLSLCREFQPFCEVLCKQVFWMKCGWDFFFVKFLLLRLKEIIPGTNQEAQARVALEFSMCVFCHLLEKDDQAAVWKRVRTPCPLIPLPGLRRGHSRACKSPGCTCFSVGSP